MRYAALCVLCLGMVSIAAAQDLGNRARDAQTPVRNEGTNGPSLSSNPRQGGDTVAEATLILSLPCADSGTTAGYADDYDEVCPYYGSTAPDVVYAYTPDTDIRIDIDLCGSAYYTKLYVYDEFLDLVDCNEIFYMDDECGIYVSKLEGVVLAAASTYFIVIDGFDDDFGDYELVVSEHVPCVLECPAEAALEGEPELMDEYLDWHNGGCNTDELNPLTYTQVVQPGEFCGVSGWYGFQGDFRRDTDWFVITLGPEGYLTWTCDAEQRTRMYELLDMPFCPGLVPGQQAMAGRCLPASLTIYGDPGGEVYFWIGPPDAIPPGGFVGHEYDYVCNFDTGVVATTTATWSQLKALYR